MLRFVDIPPVWMLAFGLAAVLLDRALPVASVAVPDWVGWIVCGAGLAWALAAGVLFLARRTPVEPRHEPQVLLVEGPFRWNRNPIYTGMTMVLLGLAIILGSVSAFIPAIAFPFLITWRFVRDEERALAAAFGTRAEEYLARTRRW
ncbi:MAG: isoprenylcysteine carboxylmethyltransferase family protein [Bauldia sp.]|nr:isoprenylcysteine carboxylmethyltransferase family protein [Bauldia sp.]